MEIDGGSDKIGERPTKVVANQATKKVRLKEVEMEFDAESDGGPQHSNLISFTDKLILRMAQFVVLRLLSKKIGYNVLDLENDTSWRNLREMVDYTKALSKGLWVIYGHYLTVHPWRISFCTSLPYSKSVVTWKHLPRLLSEMHKQSILQLV
ncbi:hypothetical protein Goari_011846, partial [Gossypium aridum]|nr:hypothetical protein [Gossypium aridum]